MSLVARHLEAQGFATVVIGCGRDIVEQCAVARFLFVDFPLGNPCGRPGDSRMQRQIVTMALDLAERAFAPQTTVQAPYAFDDDGSWRNTFMELKPELLDELSAAGEERRRKQAARKAPSG